VCQHTVVITTAISYYSLSHTRALSPSLIEGGRVCVCGVWVWVCDSGGILWAVAQPVVGIVQNAHCAVVYLYFRRRCCVGGWSPPPTTQRQQQQQDGKVRTSVYIYICWCVFRPSISDGSFATGSAPHPPTPIYIGFWVGHVRHACCLVLGLSVPVCGTSEALLEREPTHSNHHRTRRVCVCVCVCAQQKKKVYFR